MELAARNAELTEVVGGGSSELNTNSTASPVAVGDRHEVAQAAGSV